MININAIKKACQKVWQETKKNVVLAIVIAIVVILAVAGLLIYKFYFAGTWVRNISAQAAGQKAVEFINENYLTDTNKAELKEVTKFSSMYKIVFKMNVNGQDQEQVAYVTKDGKYLFPEMQGIPILMDKVENTAGNNTNNNADQVASCDAIQKTDSPSLEAFIVSQCPFGLQMQRIAAKLIADEPTAGENIIMRYIGSISNGKVQSMHGEEEAQENLRQICLREETNKYWSYVSCFMQEGKTDACLTSTGVNKADLNACMADQNRGLKYATEDFALTSDRGVSGSPTLFINGADVDEFSFGGRTEDAAKSIICCASNSQPSYCSKELSKDSAASGYSAAYSTGSTTNQGSGCN